MWESSSPLRPQIEEICTVPPNKQIHLLLPLELTPLVLALRLRSTVSPHHPISICRLGPALVAFLVWFTSIQAWTKTTSPCRQSPSASIAVRVPHHKSLPVFLCVYVYCYILNIGISPKPPCTYVDLLQNDWVMDNIADFLLGGGVWLEEAGHGGSDLKEFIFQLLPWLSASCLLWEEQLCSCQGFHHTLLPSSQPHVSSQMVRYSVVFSRLLFLL